MVDENFVTKQLQIIFNANAIVFALIYFSFVTERFKHFVLKIKKIHLNKATRKKNSKDTHRKDTHRKGIHRKDTHRKDIHLSKVIHLSK